jgi:hypothetical protein
MMNTQLRTTEIRLRLWLQVAILLSPLPGCIDRGPARGVAMAQRQRAKDPPYAWGFCNSTGKSFDNVHIDFVINGAHATDGPGRLSSGGTGGAQSMFAPGPIPQTVTVSWRDGEHFLREDVEVASKIADPAGFTGTIWFKFLSNGTVAVIPMTEAEMTERARRGEDYAPN